MTNHSPLKVVVFLGSVRPGRMCERVSHYIVKKLHEKKYDVEVLDPLILDLPLLDRPMVIYPSDRAGAPVVLVECEKKIKAADAMVVISGEYNHTIPPALTNLMSYFDLKFYGFKPSGIVCYSIGPFGGVRAAMQLRSFLGELGCISVSAIAALPEVQNVLDDKGEPTGQNPLLDASVNKMLAQLDWMAHAMRNQRAAAGVPS